MARKRPKKASPSEDQESYEGECRVKPMTQYGIPPRIWAMFLWRLSERKREELDRDRERCNRSV
jgi:hypothetical protein